MALTGYLTRDQRITDPVCPLSRVNLLRRLHRASGLTQEEVGRRMGVSDIRVAAILQGEAEHPKPATLAALASVYGPAIYLAWKIQPSEPFTIPPPARCVVCGKPLPDRTPYNVATCSRDCWHESALQRQSRYDQRKRERRALEVAS